MTFALILYAYALNIPVVLHGYQDRNECERAATFIEDKAVSHICLPERHE